MATRNTDNDQSFLAGADLSGTDYRFVKMHATTANAVDAATAATDSIIGVRQNSPASGVECHVVIGGKAKLTLGGTVTVGAWLTATTAGAAIATVTLNNVVGAQALEAGVSGDVIEVLVRTFTLSA